MFGSKSFASPEGSASSYSKIPSSFSFIVVKWGQAFNAWRMPFILGANFQANLCIQSLDRYSTLEIGVKAHRWLFWEKLVDEATRIFISFRNFNREHPFPKDFTWCHGESFLAFINCSMGIGHFSAEIRVIERSTPIPYYLSCHLIHLPSAMFNVVVKSYLYFLSIIWTSSCLIKQPQVIIHFSKNVLHSTVVMPTIFCSLSMKSLIK